MSRARRGIVVVVAVLVAALGLAPPAGAVETWWVENQDLGEFQSVVPTADGRAVAVGQFFDPSGVHLRIQGTDGTWGEVTPVLGPAPFVDFLVEGITTPTGVTYVMWATRVYNTDDGIVGGVRLDGDTWTPLPTIGVDTLGISAFDVAAGPDGSVRVAWYDDAPWPSELGTAVLDDDGWSDAHAIQLSGVVYDGVRVSVTSEGVALVTALRSPGAGQMQVVTAWTVDGSGWSDPSVLSDPSMPASRPEVVATADGEAVVSFNQPVGGTDTALRAAAFDGAGWAAAVTLRQGRWIGEPSMAAGPDGSVLLAVAQPHLASIPHRARVLAFTRAGGQWSAAETVLDYEGYDMVFPYDVDVAIGADGTTAIVTEFDPEDYMDFVVVTARQPGSGWADAGVLSDPDETTGHPAVAVADDGLIHVTWHGTTTLRYVWGFVVPFDDLQPGAFYVVPVLWAADNGLTTGVGGTGLFQPHREITRAEAMTALWRLEGSEPGAPPSGFSDVQAGAFYTAAVNWARAEGLTTGVGGSNRFEPNRTITRGELVTLLWRLAASPAAPPAGFDDVSPGAFYAAAVDWARHEGITTGVGGSNRFEPGRTISRAETFTLIYRYVLSTL